MDKIQIIARINGSHDARTLIDDLATNFEAEFVKIHGHRIDDARSKVADVIARHIADACAWSADRPKKYKAARGTKEGECLSPSQVRKDVVDDLMYVADLFAAGTAGKRLRGERIISKYLVDVLRKEGLVGLAILSEATTADLGGTTENDRSSPGLGGNGDLENDGGLTTNFDDLSVLTSYSDVNARLLPRKLARAHHAGGTGFVRADPVLWRLTEQVTQVLADSVNGEGGNIDLRILRERLDKEERHHFATCCQQAARLLEINWRMHESIPDGSPRHSTISDFLSSPPLHQSVVRIFELLAPTRELDEYDQFWPVPLEEVLISRTERQFKNGHMVSVDVLAKQAQDFAISAIHCAQDVIACLGWEVELFDDAKLLRASEHVLKRQKRMPSGDWEDNNSDDDLEERIFVAIGLLVRGIWSIRTDWLPIRGYVTFIDWYCRRLLEKAATKEQIELAGACNATILRFLEDWSSELNARFELGLYYEGDFAQRADGKPLQIPDTPKIVVDCPMRLTRYFEDAEYGAVPDSAVVDALITAVSLEHPHAKDLWHAATTFLDPYPLIPKTPRA